MGSSGRLQRYRDFWAVAQAVRVVLLMHRSLDKGHLTLCGCWPHPFTGPKACEHTVSFTAALQLRLGYVLVGSVFLLVHLFLYHGLDSQGLLAVARSNMTVA